MYIGHTRYVSPLLSVLSYGDPIISHSLPSREVIPQSHATTYTLHTFSVNLELYAIRSRSSPARRHSIRIFKISLLKREYMFGILCI